MTAAVAVLVAGCSSGQSSASRDRSAALADFAAIRAGHCAEVVTKFDIGMRARLGADAVCHGWQQFVAAFGSYLSHEAPRVTDFRGDTVVRVGLHMAKRPGEFRITFDSTGRIAGLYFLRPGVPL
ncbi:MAG: hypothetical protein JO222_03400 [Frankiales bacterium]|nr:hypothetical protein [Frankiales bacterium]